MWPQHYKLSCSLTAYDSIKAQVLIFGTTSHCFLTQTGLSAEGISIIPQQPCQIINCKQMNECVWNMSSASTHRWETKSTTFRHPNTINRELERKDFTVAPRTVLSPSLTSTETPQQQAHTDTKWRDATNKILQSAPSSQDGTWIYSGIQCTQEWNHPYITLHIQCKLHSSKVSF